MAHVPRLLLLLAACFLLSPSAVLAQAAPPAPQAATAPPPTAAAKPKIELFGFLQFDYYAGDGADAIADDSTFFVRRARLCARGKVSERIGFMVVAALDGTDAKTLGGDVTALDAFVDIDLDPRLQLRLGQFKYDFDREGKRSGSSLPLITRARVTNTLVGRLGQNGEFFRDIGAELHGAVGSWGYAAGVINGNGTNKRDDNGDADFYLRGTAQPREGLSFGAGYFRGTALLASGSSSSEEVWTVDALYERGPLAVMGAYYEGSYGRPRAADVEPAGYYLLATYLLRGRLELALRYQELDQDAGRAARGYDSADVGVSWYLQPPKSRWGGTKVALNYMERSAESDATASLWEERGAAVSGRAVRDVVLVRLQVPF